MKGPVIRALAENLPKVIRFIAEQCKSWKVSTYIRAKLSHTYKGMVIK